MKPMSREQAIKMLMEIGEIIANEKGYTEVKASDINCGVWDSGSFPMSEWLKGQYGEMKDVKFHSGEKDKYVEIRYRFGNPVLGVKDLNENGKQAFACIEISDTAMDGDELVNTGDYVFSESIAWQMEGIEMLHRLLAMWQERGGR